MSLWCVRRRQLDPPKVVGEMVMAMQPPSRAAVKQMLMALLVGDTSREEAADWAVEWVRIDDPGIDDPVVWSALCHLARADLQTAPGEYLHHEDNFHSWLDELETAMEDDT